jgi:hypothetical protein
VRGGEAVGMAARVVVTDVRGRPLQHRGMVEGEAPVYSRGNSVGVAHHKGGSWRHEEDKRQGQSARRLWSALVAEISCGDGRGAVVDLSAA